MSANHSDGKNKFPCKFQLSLKGGTGREKAECDFEPFPTKIVWKTAENGRF